MQLTSRRSHDSFSWEENNADHAVNGLIGGFERRDHAEGYGAGNP